MLLEVRDVLKVAIYVSIELIMVHRQLPVKTLVIKQGIQQLLLVILRIQLAK
jgi:hypothetical protein